MAYGSTPFAKLRKNDLFKMHAITDPRNKIAFPPLKNAALHDTLQRCLDREPQTRITMQVQSLQKYFVSCLAPGEVTFQEKLEVFCAFCMSCLGCSFSASVFSIRYPDATAASKTCLPIQSYGFLE